MIIKDYEEEVVCGDDSSLTDEQKGGEFLVEESYVLTSGIQPGWVRDKTSQVKVALCLL